MTRQVTFPSNAIILNYDISYSQPTLVALESSITNSTQFLERGEGRWQGTCTIGDRRRDQSKDIERFIYEMSTGVNYTYLNINKPGYTRGSGSRYIAGETDDGFILSSTTSVTRIEEGDFFRSAGVEDLGGSGVNDSQDRIFMVTSAEVGTGDNADNWIITVQPNHALTVGTKIADPSIMKIRFVPGTPPGTPATNRLAGPWTFSWYEYTT